MWPSPSHRTGCAQHANKAELESKAEWDDQWLALSIRPGDCGRGLCKSCRDTCPHGFGGPQHVLATDVQVRAGPQTLGTAGRIDADAVLAELG